MKPLTTGVAVITFNGMKYLPRQLDSIVTQTRKVEHIVVSDDRSSDGTWEFLEEWARQAPVRVTLIRNERQLGLIANFEQAVSAVEADIIFSSDQDDVWFPNKVELLAAIFEQRPEVQLAHSDAILVDGDGEDLDTTLLRELELSNAERNAIHAGNAFEVYCRRNVVTGATAAFRNDLLQMARPLPDVTYHDAWLALIAAATGEVYLLNAPTIQYRQHGANLVGVKKLGPFTRMRHFWWKISGPRPLKITTQNRLSFYATLHRRMAENPGAKQVHTALVTEALQFAECRCNFPSNGAKRAAAVLRTMSAGHYRKFSYNPWEDAIRDILNR